MTDKQIPLPVSTPKQPAPTSNTGRADVWMRAALSQGAVVGLREQIAIPSPKGGYRVIDRDVTA